MKTSPSRFLRRKPAAGIRHEIGYAYVARVGYRGISSHKRPSSARVLENGIPLPGPANALHDDIRQLGGGRYSFWHNVVYFSTPDNSDPRTNGRVYTFEYTPWTRRLLTALVEAIRHFLARSPTNKSTHLHPPHPRNIKNISKPVARIRPEIGHAYVARTGYLGISSHKRPSSARMFENGMPLPGVANALHDDIRQLGGGRYSFWHNVVYFSTPDNSDPRTNGRVYTFEYSPWLWRFLTALIAGVRRLLIRKRVDKSPRLLSPGADGIPVWEKFYWLCFNIVFWSGEISRGIARRREKR